MISPKKVVLLKKMSVDKNNKCKNKMHHYLGSSKYVPETGTLSPKG